MVRFDFTGLGDSPGVFADTNLSSNIAQVQEVATWMQAQGRPAQLLIGHSLGGVAVSMAAASIKTARAICLLNPPPAADHLIRHFGTHVQQIMQEGAAEVPIYDPSGKRRFLIKRQLLEDLRRHDFVASIRSLQLPLLMLYSESDDLITLADIQSLLAQVTVSKQLKVLPGADHILSDRNTGITTGHTIAQWFKEI